MKRKIAAAGCLVFAMHAGFVSAGADCWCGVLHPEETVPRTRLTGGSGLQAAVVRETQLHVVDVLIAFDLSASEWLARNGKGTIEDYACGCIEKANSCLEKSGLIGDFRFRLAGVVQVNANASLLGGGDTFACHSEVLGGLIDSYGKVTAKGEWKKVTDMRERVGADIVSVLIDNGYGGCMGLGYELKGRDYGNLSRIASFGDWAYHSVSIQSADVDYTHLHEIAHNMGCGHPDASCASAAAIPLGPQLFDYSAGYYLWIGDVGYYTVMGYNFGGLASSGAYDPSLSFKPLPYFSSPDLAYGGHALGTERNDNVRTLRETYQYVAQYRVSKLAEEPVNEGDEPIVEGEFHPVNPIKAAYPYVGGVYDGAGREVGVIQLSATREKSGTSKVTATVIGMDGKKSKTKAVQVNCGRSATMPPVAVKGWGALSLTLGGAGFSGTLGDGYEVRTARVGGDLASAAPAVSLVDFDFVPPLAGYELVAAALPEDEPIDISGGKWKFAKAASIKYKKVVDDRESKLSHYELLGCGKNLDPQKPNVSGLKLSYAAKTGLFKGTFKVFATNAAVTPSGKSPKLKKYSLKVSGFVIDGIGVGVAQCKKPSGQWDVRID